MKAIRLSSSVAAMALGGLLVAAGTWIGSNRPASSAQAAAGTPGLASTTSGVVTRRDLVNRVRVDGTVTYANSGQRVINHAAGTVTGMAGPGTIVQRGQTLYEVDGDPVILMFGARPAYRTLGIGVTGPDVVQLEENLIALGFGSSSLRTDGSFSSADAAAVKRWQKALGLPQTGVVEWGRVAFLPGPFRVGVSKASVGEMASPGQDVMDGSATTRDVTVELDASRQSSIKVGDPVEVVAGQVRAAGRVSSIATVATPTNAGPGAKYQGIPTATITVVISLADQTLSSQPDQAPVQVAVVTESAHHVLAVPIAALLATADGGYSVEVLGSKGSHQIDVTTGLFDDDDGLVQVEGAGLNEGMRIVVAS